MLKAHLHSFTTNTPDILTLTDNYLDDKTNDNAFPIDGYSSVHRKGISVYYKNNLHAAVVDDISMPIARAHTIVVQIHDTCQKTNAIRTIISIYRRPHADAKFLPELQALIDAIVVKSPRTTIDIQGDMNLNILRLTPRHDVTQFLLNNSLYTTITSPTRYSSRYKTATSIDWSITTSLEHITAGTIAPPLADHLATCTIFHKTPPRQTQRAAKGLSKHRYAKLRPTILALAKAKVRSNCSMQSDRASVDERCEAILDALQTTVRQFETLPKKRRKQWCNTKLRKQIREQHRLHKKQLANPTQANIEKHRASRNAVRKAIQNAKRAHLAHQLENTKHDPKRQAQVLRTLIPNSSKARQSPTRLKHDGRVLTDPIDIANAMNTHYITIGQRTSQSIPDHSAMEQRNSPPPRARLIRHAVPRERAPPEFELKETTEKTMLKTLRRVNRHKASDIYKIPPGLIKDLAPFLAPILTDLFNRAVREHKYPDALKLTKLIELYKKEDPELATNYRPISLLPIVGKVIDTIVNQQLMAHLTDHDIISPTQYAFRPHSNTTTALQAILNDIHKHKSSRHPTLAIYVDLSKAYDTIEHDKLLHKLRHTFNFTADTVAFFKSYFTNRRQSTHTQYAQSDIDTITHGIPQGSTLSTTLFLLYINDIINTVPQSTVYTYADDTTLVITAPTLEGLAKLAQSELTTLITYFHTNNLVPNAKKTVYTTFRPKNDPIALLINGISIKRAPQARLLGIRVQDNLKFDATVNAIVRKLHPLAHTFKYATQLLPLETMKQLYYTHVYPHLIYAIPVWGTSRKTPSGAHATYLNPLVVMQKKLIRLVRNVPARAHTKPIMRELEILSIPSLYTLRVCAEMHPFIHIKGEQNRPAHVHHYAYAADIHNHATRRAKTSAFHLAASTGHYTEIYTAVWNSLPADIRRIESAKTFKTVLKLHLLEQQYASPV